MIYKNFIYLIIIFLLYLKGNNSVITNYNKLNYSSKVINRKYLRFKRQFLINNLEPLPMSIIFYLFNRFERKNF